MSLDNKYIFSKNSREKLHYINIVIFFISIILLLILTFIHFSKISHLLTLSLLTSISFIINMLLMIIEFSEKSRIKFYLTFMITFFISLVIFDIFQLTYSILSQNTVIGEVNIIKKLKEIFFKIEIISVVSIPIGIFLLFLNNVINTFLFPNISNSCNFNADTVSNRFAVDVISYAIYIGSLFGIIFYVFFNSEESKESFFSAVNITHIALATVGLVTFFWAAKSVKSKSIESDISRSREAGRLFSEGAVFLSVPHNDKKYVGLSYLNMIASQSEGPLQKEAIDLMADFILNANDITTANKQRIRAMEYLSDRLKTDFLDDDIDELIKLSSSELTESNVNYRFSQLNIVYENFTFSNEKKFLNSISSNNEENNDKEKCIIKRLFYRVERKLTTYIERNFINNINRKLVAYNNCNFENYSGQNGIEKIILVYAQNCSFKNCKIGIVKGYSKKPKTGQKGESTPSNNKFEQCEFSDSDGWNILRPSNRMEGEIAETIAENTFINCFYYSGHEPKGFVKERDGALLTEITSKEQFDELIGSSSFMQYAPPDD